MRHALSVLTLITGLVISASGHAAFVSSGAIAGIDSPFPAAPVPDAGDIPLQPGFVPFGTVLGNLENGCGLYRNGDAPVSAKGTDCPPGGLKKAITYDDDPIDLIVLPVAMGIGLGIIVKEGHPERHPDGPGLNQGQIEDFDIFLIDTLTDLIAFSWHYYDQGSDPGDPNDPNDNGDDDAYYAGYFEDEAVAAGSYYLSFRVPGFPDDITDGGSVEYLAQISAASVPGPPAIWLLIAGLPWLVVTNRRLSTGRRSRAPA